VRAAEELLTELGISDPADIELEAIAYCVGVEVQYRRLSSCEAQIIGYKDRAVVYVTPDTSPQRRRFSTGHELGHWHHHRGMSFVCRSSDIGRPIDEKSRDAERLADAYAGDLILLPFMVGPKLERLGEISLDGAAEIAAQFKASITATAIRCVRMTRQPAHSRRAQSPGTYVAMAIHHCGRDTCSRRRRFPLVLVCLIVQWQQGICRAEGARKLLVRQKAH
jgi:Zn-dependent peptidase ImmA (M78 family)